MTGAGKIKGDTKPTRPRKRTWNFCACGCGRWVYGEYARTHRPGVPLADRLWGRTEVTETGCWEFQGSRTPSNYGQLSLDKSGKLISAHRAAWTLTYGPIAAGLFVCHHCDNPPCCNPDHLFLGTCQENIDDAMDKGRIQSSRARGINSGNARLTDGQVAEIRARYKLGVRRSRKTGCSSSELADEFSVTPQYISQVARRVWRVEL